MPDLRQLKKRSIHVKAGERAEFVVDYAGTGANGVGPWSLEMHVGKDAEVYVVQLLNSPGPGEFVVSNRFYLEERSKLSAVILFCGEAVTRCDSIVEFQGEHAEVSLKALSVLTGDAHIAHRVVVHHARPWCTSRQVFKNILFNRSRSEFDSLVHVHRDAQKSDSRQLNKNLLLSDRAHGLARPELKIEADDVSCTHGATVGQLEDEELFYLRSRGLSNQEARLVLTVGFAQDILEAVSAPELRVRLEALVRERLQNAMQGLADASNRGLGESAE